MANTEILGRGIMTHYENETRISSLITDDVDIGTPINLIGTIRINAGFVSVLKADVGVLFCIGSNY